MKTITILTSLLICILQLNSSSGYIRQNLHSQTKFIVKKEIACPHTTMFKFSKNKNSLMPFLMLSTSDEDNEDSIEEENSSKETVDDISELEKIISDSLANNNTATFELDPIAKATADYENKLQLQIESLENILRSERIKLSRAKDKVSESGKNGYFIIQAQVNDFMVKCLYLNVQYLHLTFFKYKNSERKILIRKIESQRIKGNL